MLQHLSLVVRPLRRTVNKGHLIVPENNTSFENREIVLIEVLMREEAWAIFRTLAPSNPIIYNRRHGKISLLCKFDYLSDKIS